MAKAKINEKGELINPDTGEKIGVKSGNRTTISSSDSERLFTLEDYGVRIPDFPDDDDDDGRKDDDEDFTAAPQPLMQDSVPVAQSQPEQESSSSPVSPSAPTSFRKVKSKYEITKDSYFVIKFGLFQKEDGRFVPINEEAVNATPNAELHWVKFRMWNYSEELKWKSEFLEYSPVTKSQFLNTDKLNERKIKHLMLDWSFGEYEDGLKLLHCDGKLSDESYAMFMGLYPSIAGTIVDLMNLVLESNQ